MSFTEGTYFIAWPNNGFCIDLPAGNASNHEGKVQKADPTGEYTQKWQFKADPNRPGRYKIRWASQDHYLQPENNSDKDGAEIHFDDEQDDGYQAWLVEDAGSGLYIITNDGSGKCLDIESNELQAGKPIRQYSRSNGPQQKWALEPAA